MGRSSAPQLLDRAQPLAHLEAAIVDAAAGRGGLLLEGEPGIGKTTLLAAAVQRSRERGMRVLRARGGELERSYPYGVVRQLPEVVVAEAPAERRADLLSGAAGLAAGVLDPTAAEDGPHPAMAVEHGLYWLVAGLAAEAPLLLVVDDAHWADEVSLRWLVYLARRLDGLAAALVVATRPLHVGSSPVLAMLLTEAGLRRVTPAPLGAEAVAVLVRDALGGDASAAFCAACADLSEGNPLLLGDLVRTVATAGLSPDDAGAGRLGKLLPASIGRAVMNRFGHLGGHARELADAVAVLGREAALRWAATLAGLDLGTAADAAEQLADAHLLAPGRPLRFAHPLLRTAVYAAGRRAVLHAAAARMLVDEGHPAEEVATHLLACERTGNRQVVDGLLAAAQAAGHAGAPDAAVAFLRRALEEPPDPTVRVQVLRELGRAEGAVHDPAAAGHLVAALDRLATPASGP